jgi:hypothetical protein
VALLHVVAATAGILANRIGSFLVEEKEIAYHELNFGSNSL